MSCESLQILLAGYVDGELEPEEHEQVESHLAIGCERCQAEVEDLRQVAGFLSEQVPMPSAARWAEFDRDLRAGINASAPSAVPFPWRGAVAAAAIAASLLVAVFVAGHLTEPRVALAVPRFQLPAVQHQDPSWAPREPMALPPLDRVRGFDAAQDQLSEEAIAALTSYGLVQVNAETSLGDFYPQRLPLGLPRPLATADASLLVHGAVAGRAALALEREMIIPSVRELLSVLLAELRLFEATGRTGAVRRAARLVRERLGVAAVLYGVDPLLPSDSLKRVEAEAESIRSGAPAAISPVLDASFDYSACGARGIYVGDEELRAHAQAVRWLSLTGLSMDGSNPDHLRAGCLLVMALARGRLSDGAYGLYGQARIEAAVEVVFGEPDELTVFDVLRCMKQAFPNPSPQLSILADGHALERVLKGLVDEGRARGVDRIRSLGRSGFRLHLLGNTRSVEAQVYTRLTALPDRSRPSSLDLLYLLSQDPGRRRVRTAISAERLDLSPDYDLVQDLLYAETAGLREPKGQLSLRSSLERSRLLAVSALLDGRPDNGPLPFQRSAPYRDRLLLAALGGLNLPSPDSAPRQEGDELEGVVPLVEPLPTLHARLASSAERLAQVLERLGGKGPRIQRAIDELREVKRLEEALRDASLDALAGRRSPADTEQVLRGYGALVRRLGPGDVRSAEDLFEVRGIEGDVRVLHRVVHRLDRLYVVTVDPATGKPQLACGPAMGAAERWITGARLTPQALEGLNIPDPLWAQHLRRAEGR